MNNNNIWGPPAWIFLHTITFNYPNNPSEQDKQNYYNFFDSLKYVLPCDKCKKHYKENSRDLKDNLNSRDDLVKWLIDIHNEVNKSNNKRIYSYEEVNNIYIELYNSGESDMMNIKKEKGKINIYLLLSCSLIIIIFYNYYISNNNGSS